MTSSIVAEIEADFAKVTDDDVDRFVGITTFDRQLGRWAATEIEATLGGLEAANSYRWCVEPEAFASGIEAWLQLQVLRSLRFSRPSRDLAPCFVIRMIEGPCPDITLLGGSDYRFVCVSIGVVDSHFALLRRFREMRTRGEQRYDDEDRWCHSNLVGGAEVEWLVRKELQIAYTDILKMLAWDGAYATTTSPLPADARNATEAQPPAARGAPLDFADRLAWGPIQFLVLRETAQHRLGHGLDYKTPFWRASAGDLVGMLDFRKVEGSIPPEDEQRARLFAVVSMGVALQMTRVRCVRNGTSEAVRRLCLRAAQSSPQTVQRLGQIEVQMRFLNAAPFQVGPEGDDSAGHLLLDVFDEMQITFGVAAASAIVETGGRATIEDLCRAEWYVVAEHVQHENVEHIRDDNEATG